MDRRKVFYQIGSSAMILGLGPLVALSTQAQTATDIFSQLGLGKPSLRPAQAELGLKDTLSLGTIASITRLGKPDGFWADPVVRLPLPKTLETLQKTLKPIGGSKMLDELHLSLNRAAETCAPTAKGLFIDAIKAMTIKDAITIVKGEPTSGTQYLKTATSPRLISLFKPSVAKALDNVGAVGLLDRAIRRNKLQALIKTDAKTYLSDYAVGLTLGGIFHYIGVEETAIRRDPKKRTTALLKTVFG